ncbi:hypothetical protein ACTXT7_003573 [Hymenolepis weldensis]
MPTMGYLNKTRRVSSYYHSRPNELLYRKKEAEKSPDNGKSLNNFKADGRVKKEVEKLLPKYEETACCLLKARAAKVALNLVKTSLGERPRQTKCPLIELMIFLRLAGNKNLSRLKRPITKQDHGLIEQLGMDEKGKGDGAEGGSWRKDELTELRED